LRADIRLNRKARTQFPALRSGVVTPSLKSENSAYKMRVAPDKSQWAANDVL